ncbi:MAG: DNA/RNA nuclease SfsA [Infirmifilum sp.]
MLLQLESPSICTILRRVNRFVVEVKHAGKLTRAHINNTGRLLEYIKEGKTAYCLPHRGKTEFRLIAVDEEGSGALIDTQLQMKSFEEAVRRGLLDWAKCEIVSRAPRVGSSKLDYLLSCGGYKVFTELKSAVLRQDGYAMYPDCPTLRGRRHIWELIELARIGHKALIVFVAGIRGVTAFKPYVEGDAEVARLLKMAYESGVGIRAFSVYYEPETSKIILDKSSLEIVL